MARKTEAWRAIVEGVGLDLNATINFVTAEQIKQFSGFEPRNMAYMDSRESLPSIFSENGVFPLPVRNGRYALVKGEGFHDLEPITTPVVPFVSQAPFPLTSLARAKSESQHLDYAYHSGLLSKFTGATDMHATIRGRKYTPDFSFRVRASPLIDVSGVQFEVDAGYESRENILLFECKAVESTSFIIRQLYYPYRAWGIESSKPVRAFFFVASPETKEYRVWEYAWDDRDDYSAIALQGSARYSISQAAVDARKFAAINVTQDPTFIPQADDVTKLLEFPFVVANGLRKADTIAAYFRFDERQSSYYREATEGLGLVTLGPDGYALTQKGMKFVSLSPNHRTEYFLQLMLEVPIIRDVLNQVLIAGQEGIGPSKIIDLIKASTNRYSGTTLGRRATSIVAWFREVSKAVPLITVTGRGASTRIRAGSGVNARLFI